jgi:two-component system cell cycle sensor histidine kinase/response regulator CckA
MSQGVPPNPQSVAVALRESERAYRTLVETSHDLIWSIDLQGRCTFVNQASRRILGYEPAEMLGRVFTEFQSPEQAQRDLQTFARILAGAQHFSHEMVVQRKDGTPVWLNVNMVPLRSEQGAITGATGTAQDITDRKRAEQARERLHSLTRATLESTADAILVANVAGRIEIFNRRFTELWHLPADILGSGDEERALAWVLDQLVAPEAFLRRVRQLYRYPREVSFDELLFKDGRIVERYSRPQILDGEVVGRVWSFRDVTEHRQAQKARTELEARLRQAQKMEAIGTLAGGIAHDFNNILTAIGGHAALLGRGGTLGPMEGESLREITECVDRAARFTRQLLALSRHQPLNLREIDLNDVLGRMDVLLRRTLEETIAVRTRTLQGPAWVRADEGMMEQVLLNLAVNARDAMPAGGALEISLAAVDFGPGAADRAGPHYCLRVSDTGRGIPADVLPRIFDPFFTTKEAGLGSGLGLATVYTIVQQHDGWIDVASTVGSGTTFRLHLPAGRPAPAAGEPPTPSTPLPDPAPGPGSILIVEDEDAVRSMVRLALEQQGFSVLTASSGSEGLATWRRHANEIRLILTDMVMPGGPSGPELARSVWRENSNLPVIFMSGYSPEATDRDLNLMEGVNYLPKPFALHRLRAMITLRLQGGTGAASQR